MFGFLRGSKQQQPPKAQETMQPTQAARDEAKRTPNGWVYVIEGNYGPDNAIPPQAIRGAWKVDANGEIIGEFIPNSNYRAAK
jgi:hypothetical protein